MIALLLAHVVALALFGLLTEWEIGYNARRIQRDGAKDSLHDTFHRQRFTLRAAVAVLVASGASLPAWGHWLSCGLSAWALLVAGAVWFGYRFNTGLNRARGLPAYYVSFATFASRFDRFIADKVRRDFPMKGADADTRMRFWYLKADCVLRRYLRLSLGIGAGLYLIHLVLALVWL
ncbi:hypothetical protein F0P96_10670 [Hymenobacter busanensis]|uniref:Uncharacterized protein n=1 Tax=Hymenobacter busanensis TaxID=2607656 RepID=A0A7L4ZYH4_9BACT|nr:hypothetical protein [Hymenobacter busanensis]KAA9333424.1 hypothetical protein F0P96_10670 [Hymenobacter busanensis]QHJ07895.1 hypothetical protein GUY19_11630 [Hymenobacter busanensis]